jgi:hypothetical protein
LSISAAMVGAVVMTAFTLIVVTMDAGKGL